MSEQAELLHSDARPALARPGEYLTFRLGAEAYGIDILQVQEIRSHEPPTRIAGAPALVPGVINLRGVIVPLVDLRVKLGSGSAGCDASTVVIMLNLRGRLIGAIVDAVSDVTELDAKSIRPAPRLRGLGDNAFISGIGSLGDRMLVLIDLDILLSGQDLGLAPAL